MRTYKLSDADQRNGRALLECHKFPFSNDIDDAVTFAVTLPSRHLFHIRQEGIGPRNSANTHYRTGIGCFSELKNKWDGKRVRQLLSVSRYLEFAVRHAQKCESWCAAQNPESVNAPDIKGFGRVPAICDHFALLAASLVKIVVDPSVRVFVLEHVHTFFTSGRQHAFNAVKLDKGFRYFDSSIYNSATKKDFIEQNINPVDLNIDAYLRNKDDGNQIRQPNSRTIDAYGFREGADHVDRWAYEVIL